MAFPFLPDVRLVPLQAVHGVFHGGFELLGSAIHGESQGVGLIGDGHGLMAFEAGFHHAALVGRAGLFTVLIIEVDLDAGDVAADVAQGVGDDGFSFSDQFWTAGDVVVGIDLNEHKKMGWGLVWVTYRIRMGREF